MEKIKYDNIDYTNIILSIDVGSSSIRTTAYQNLSTTTTKKNDNNNIVDVVAIPSCSSSIPRAIQMNDQLDAVDHAI